MSTDHDSGPGPVVSGWRETLVSVDDIDRWVQTYAEVGGWQVRHEGVVSNEVLEYLKVQPGSRAREVIVGCEGADFGFVRLVRFDGGRRHPVIRSYGRPWETGGWFDLNARVEDMQARFEQLQDLGWGGVSDPIEYDFGPFTVKEWLTCGPDGVQWAIIERVRPPLEPEVRPGRMGPHFNSTQIVDDIDDARRFYRDILGFTPAVEVEDQPMMPAPLQNVLGLPNETAAVQRWNIAMLRAPGEEGGSVEIISLPGISGRNFASLADPPNRGIISLRFPVDDVPALHRELNDADVPIVNAPRVLELPPYGNVTIMTASGPCGARLDFFQAA
ncbi:MAG: VOC family protein [Gammaproteobacteria bacterium]|nr:VOC family protein [Gammaproteobacteria bacterium]